MLVMLMGESFAVFVASRGYFRVKSLGVGRRENFQLLRGALHRDFRVEKSQLLER